MANDEKLNNLPQEAEASDNPEELESEEEKETKVKKLLILGIIVILLIFIALVIVFLKRSGRLTAIWPSKDNSVNITASYYGGDSNVSNDNSANIQVTPSKTVTPDEEAGGQTPERLPSGVEVEARLSLPVPKQSGVSTQDSIPEGAVKIIGTPDGFTPNEFEVKRGEDVILALTAQTDRPVVLTFYNPNLAAISIGCGPGETRWVSFNAPSKAGEYVFRNDTIGLNGQTGKMIVK
jgi:cytoskeletal protein RodZ